MENSKPLVWLKNNLNVIIFGLFFIGMFFLMFCNYANFTDMDYNELGSNSFTSSVFSSSLTIGSESYSVVGSEALFIFMGVVYVLSGVAYIVLELLKSKISKRVLFGVDVILMILLIACAFIFTLGGSIIPLMNGFGDTIFGTTDNVFGGLNIAFTLILVLILFGSIFETKPYTIREICETAILVALAVILDQFASIKIQANGGSISFAAVPLFIIAIRYGGFKGFIASSFVFGLITCLMDGYGFQTYPFDYFVALSGYGFVGTFFNFAKRFYDQSDKKKQFIYSFIAILISGIPVMVVRYFGHMVSAGILYQPITWEYNFYYQSTYVPGTVWVSIATTLVLLEPILIINRVFPTSKRVELKNEK